MSTSQRFNLFASGLYFMPRRIVDRIYIIGDVVDENAIAQSTVGANCIRPNLRLVWMIFWQVYDFVVVVYWGGSEEKQN